MINMFQLSGNVYG